MFGLYICDYVLSVTTCAAPPIPPHASSNYTQFIYNYSDVIGYTCDTGYETLSGNASRMCLEGGSWSGNPLNCSSDCFNIMLAYLILGSGPIHEGAIPIDRIFFTVLHNQG